ncbi:MAG: ABC transporter ATP-binding protein, partial [Thermodesulfovibrio sp.]|nr:ABC transporter ATP-binding protein [Thermodesulfovibrio sp.]
SGELISIMGPSGSGKTTLLNMIGLLDKPTKGRVFIEGIDVNKLNEIEMAKIRNYKIGFIFQQFNLVNRLTVQENIELPLIARGIPGNERRKIVLEALLKAGGNEVWLKKKPNQLSGGEQQRVAIARALVTNPKIILADEPTGNLDTTSARKVVETLIKLNELKQTIVIVTHNIEVANCTQKIYLLRDGIIVGIKEPEKNRGIIHT